MQLLEYTTNDIRIEMQVHRSRLDLDQELPTHTMRKTGGKLQMQSSPTRLRIDSYERRASMGSRGVAAQTQYMKTTGRQDALQAIASYTDAGNALRDIQKGANIPDAYASRMVDSGRLELVPLAPIDISWEEGFVRQQYETARVAFEWKTEKGTGNFVPGNIQFNVTQYPSIEFRYTGGPIYVPKSADPNYNEAI